MLEARNHLQDLCIEKRSMKDAVGQLEEALREGILYLMELYQDVCESTHYWAKDCLHTKVLI